MNKRTGLAHLKIYFLEEITTQDTGQCSAFHGKLRFNKWQFVTIFPKLISDESLLCPCYDFAIFNFKNSNNIVFVVVLGFRFLFNQLLSNPKHTINNFLVVPRLWVKADCGWGRLYLRTSFIYKYKMLHGFVKVVSGGCFILINNWHYPQSGSDDFFHYFHWSVWSIPLFVNWICHWIVKFNR